MFARVEGTLPEPDDEPEFRIIKDSEIENKQDSKEAPDVSSIGPTWPPRGTSQDRIKGFEVRHIVRDVSQVEEYKMLCEQAAAGTLGKYLLERFPDELTGTNLEYSRFSFRFITESRLLPAIIQELKPAVELVIPLAGSGDFDGYSMVYIGHNLAGRESSEEDLAISTANVMDAIPRQAKGYDEIMERVRDQGYVISTPSMAERKSNMELRTQVGELYKLFSWDQESVDKMLDDENNVLGVVRFGDQVVSCGIAEVAVIPIQTEEGVKNFRMVELTEASTREEHQKRGLYTAVAAAEMRALTQLPADQQPHLVLGECNGLAPGVVKAAKDMGRTFAYEYVDMLDPSVKGYLPQHVPIDGTDRRTERNDLFPAFISQENMIKFAGIPDSNQKTDEPLS